MHEVERPSCSYLWDLAGGCDGFEADTVGRDDGLDDNRCPGVIVLDVELGWERRGQSVVHVWWWLEAWTRTSSLQSWIKTVGTMGRPAPAMSARYILLEFHCKTSRLLKRRVWLQAGTKRASVPHQFQDGIEPRAKRRTSRSSPSSAETRPVVCGNPMWSE